MKTKYLESQAGQSLILIALMMVAMVGMLGLALDGGRVFATRRASQNAADSAVFGAVRLLATRSVTATEPKIWDTITTFAKANGVVTTTAIAAYFIDQSSLNICRIPSCGGIPANATGVRVTTTLQLQPYFIDVLIGKQNVPVRAVAAAQSGPPSLGNQLAPMAIKFPCPYPPSNPDDPSCNIHYSNPPVPLFGIPQLAGGFQWVSYECSSTANSISQYLRLQKTSGPVMADRSDTYYNPLNPTQYNTPPPSPNPWICSGPGMDQSSNIRQALDCWLYPTGNGCWPPPTSYPGSRVWTIPVFDHDNGLTGSNAKYHTVMFAEFEFLGYWFQNNQYNFVGNDDPPRTPLTTTLQYCADQNQKCVMGVFKKEVTDLEIYPARCNMNGLDICGIGMSQ